MSSSYGWRFLRVGSYCSPHFISQFDPISLWKKSISFVQWNFHFLYFPVPVLRALRRRVSNFIIGEYIGRRCIRLEILVSTTPGQKVCAYESYRIEYPKINQRRTYMRPCVPEIFSKNIHRKVQTHAYKLFRKCVLSSTLATNEQPIHNFRFELTDEPVTGFK